MAERCSETTKTGEPCQAWAGPTGKCSGHAGLGLAASPQAARQAAQASAEIRQEQAATRRKTYLDHLAEELEKDAEQYVKTMRKAASEGDWRAYEAWTTRVHGKPVERIETVETDAVNVGRLSRVQRAELRRQLVSENPELVELVPKDEAA